MEQKQAIRVAVLGLRGFPNVQGGIEKHCQELYPRIALQSINVTVLGRKKYIADKTYEYDGVTIVPLWTIRQKSLETIVHTAYGVCWLIKHRKEFDLVHIHGIGPSLFAYFVPRFGLRLVITNHGPDYDRQKWGKFAKSMLRYGERLGSKYAHLVIGVSQNICKNLFKKFGIIPAYIPNGVNIPQIIQAGPALEKFGLKKGKYFLAVGRLVPEKGFHDLIEAFAGLDSNWKLAIVGDADHEDLYSKELKKKASNIPGIVMTGFQKGRSLEEIYSNAGLFVLPSYHEGLPIVGLEAMSYQLPMIVSDIPANLEIAMPHEIYPVGDIQALGNRLKEFLKQPERWNSAEVLAAKRERLEKEFNWDNIAQNTAKLYRKIVALPVRAKMKVPLEEIGGEFLIWRD